jgi:uncharacterized membrane protein YccC
MAWSFSAGFTRRFHEHTSLKPDLARACRAATAFMIPLVLHALHLLPVDPVFAAIVAQNIAMLDVRGDYRLRASLLLVMIILLASAVVLGTLAAGHLPAEVAGTMFIALGAALWRHIGSDYGPPLAAASMLLYLVSFSHARGWEDLSPTMLSVGFGGAIGVLIQMSLWPFRPQHPLRRAVGESWVAASDYFLSLRPEGDATTIPDAEAALRSTLDQTTRTLAGVAQRHKTTLPARLEALNLRAARLAVRVGAVHTALEGLRDQAAYRTLVPAFSPGLRALINTSRSIAVAVVSRQPSHFTVCEVRLRRLESLIEAMQGRLEGLGGEAQATLTPLLLRLRDAISGIAEPLRSLLDRSGERALFTLELTDLQTWQLKPLAAALNFSRRIDPSLLRFGLRMALFCGLGTWLYRSLGIPHGYWLPFTVVVVMQPDYGSTRQKAQQRVAGTVAGSLGASLLLWLFPSPVIHLILIGVGVFCFAYLLKRNYGLSVFFVTIFVVLLLEQAGLRPGAVELERIGATVAGGLIALGAAQMFWPIHERDRFPGFFEKALQANRSYLLEIQQRFHAAAGINDECAEAKHTAETSAGALFSSLGRLFADPRTPRAEVECLAALANGNQRILRIANLLFVSLQEGSIATGSVTDAYFQAVISSLEDLSKHSADLLALEKQSLSALMTVLDTLPTPPDDLSAHESLILGHLARAATEIRAMLASVCAGTNSSRATTMANA